MLKHVIFTVVALAFCYWIAADQMTSMIGLIVLANGGLALLAKIDEPLYLENDKQGS
ncbi:MAG: membrane glycosyltransferase [Bradymonadia bacterium]|jgi:membrane glycosyltransferase